MLIVTTMCKIFLAMVVGFYCVKRGVFKEGGIASISSFLIRIATPMYVIYSMSSADHGDTAQVITLFVVGICIYFGLIVFGILLFKIWKVPSDRVSIYKLMLVFSNCGLMGYPVCQAFMGDQAVFFLAILNLPYNILFYSYGIFMLAKSIGKSSKFDLKSVFNVPSICCLFALVLYFTGIKLPDFINESLGFVGSTMSALSMICIGGTIAGYSLKETLSDKSLYGITLLRLAVIPFTIHLILSLILNDTYIVNLATMSVGMPVGSMVVMGAIEYGGNEKVASAGVALTTLLSIITIPIMAICLGLS